MGPVEVIWSNLPTQTEPLRTGCSGASQKASEDLQCGRLHSLSGKPAPVHVIPKDHPFNVRAPASYRQVDTLVLRVQKSVKPFLGDPSNPQHC